MACVRWRCNYQARNMTCISVLCGHAGLKLCEKDVCKAIERNSHCAMERKADFLWKFNVMWFESGVAPRGYWIWTVSSAPGWCSCLGRLQNLWSPAGGAVCGGPKSLAGGTVALGLTLSALLTGFLQVSGTVYDPTVCSTMPFSVWWEQTLWNSEQNKPFLKIDVWRKRQPSCTKMRPWQTRNIRWQGHSRTVEPWIKVSEGFADIQQAG